MPVALPGMLRVRRSASGRRCRGGGFFPATGRICRLKSRANARCAARDATRTAISIWAAMSWGRILSGYRPNLSIEITRECPLRCPGCYAYGDQHLGGGVVLRELADYKGQELIDGVLELLRRRKP